MCNFWGSILDYTCYYISFKCNIFQSKKKKAIQKIAIKKSWASINSLGLWKSEHSRIREYTFSGRNQLLREDIWNNCGKTGKQGCFSTYPPSHSSCEMSPTPQLAVFRQSLLPPPPAKLNLSPLHLGTTAQEMKARKNKICSTKRSIPCLWWNSICSHFS